MIIGIPNAGLFRFRPNEILLSTISEKRMLEIIISSPVVSIVFLSHNLQYNAYVGFLKKYHISMIV